MIVLSISDIIVPLIYSPQIHDRFSNVNLVIGCGDLPYYYQEYIVSLLNVPLFFVRGNHDKELEYGANTNLSAPGGAIDLHRRIIKFNGLLIGGIEGSLRYRKGPFQYTQAEMWRHVFSLFPALLSNRVLYGRYLDVFVTHAPPRGIHDETDLTHRGINAFRWFIETFHPAYHFHGHVHVIKPETITETHIDGTAVLNTYGFRVTEIADFNHSKG
jgi:uncharacterized protein